jgi:hypothetical protein
MDNFFRDEESEWNFFARVPLDPIEEEVANGANQIRTLEKKLSSTSFNSIDWEYVSQFLDLEDHPNYQPVNSPSVRSIAEPELQFEEFNLNHLPAQIPRLPQPAQQIPQDWEGVSDKKIFNNMPGFLISAVQKLKNKFKFNDLVTQKTGLMNQIRECAIKLTQKILMELSSKEGNREQLRMVFNDVDEDFNHDLKQKSKKSDFTITMKRYFELLKVYGPEVMNEAKNELRNVVWTEMSLSWMSQEAQNRAFKGQNVDLKKKVFFQYMANFREELKEGEISALISRKQVLSIELFLE